MRGRKPVLRPLGEVVDLPVSAVRVPSPPAYLSESAKKCWSEVAPILVSKNIYDSDCEHLLAAFCTQYGHFVDAEKEVAKNGLMNRYMKVANGAYDRMIKLGAELGLTPVSRKRVQRNRGVNKGYLSGGKTKDNTA